VIVPGVLSKFFSGDFGSSGAVSFVIVGIAVCAIVEQSVILSGLIACVGAVPVGVVAIRLVGLVAVVGARELVAIVVAVVTGSIGRDELCDPVSGIIAPLIIGIGRAVSLVSQTGQSACKVIAIVTVGYDLGSQ
jgi:hypothetical protein